MFNITGTLSHVLVKLYDISSITYNVQITGISVRMMDSEKILTGLNDSGLTQ